MYTRIFACVHMQFFKCTPDLLVWIYACTDSLTFVLGQWFAGHPDAWERDTLCRPICPGVLRYNHCLWTYAKSSRFRRVMVNPDGAQTEAFRNSGHTFGTTPRERDAAWLAERDAYFCLVPPSSIVCRTHMSREYGHNSMQFTNNWLQRVTGV